MITILLLMSLVTGGFVGSRGQISPENQARLNNAFSVGSPLRTVHNEVIRVR